MSSSPCVKKCSLHKDVCTGCGRSLREIRNWMLFSDKEKALIAKICRERLHRNGSTI